MGSENENMRDFSWIKRKTSVYLPLHGSHTAFNRKISGYFISTGEPYHKREGFVFLL